ncbi:MAG: hypothetical protein IJG24_04245 [Selenomonadaceae bacterium]|nr:hypothetical protein [Selenomonadaceae bacterium]
MSMSDLNKRASEYGLAIFGSNHRQGRYFLASIKGEFKRISPEASIEIIAEWLDDLDAISETVTPLDVLRAGT